MKRQDEDNMKQIKTKLRNDDGSALVIAMLFAVGILALLALITTALLVSNFSTLESRDRTAYGIALDTAVNDAMNEANTYSGTITSSTNGGLYGHVGYSHSKEGILASDTANTNLDSSGLVRWRWWTAPVSSSSTNSSYYVYATAFRGNNPKEDDHALYVRVKMDSQRVTGSIADTSTQNITYVLHSADVYASQFFSESDMTVYNNTSYYTYDSAASGNNLSTVVSNTNGRLGTGSQLKVVVESDNVYEMSNIYLSEYKNSGLNDRCYLVASNGNKISGSECPTTNVASAQYGVAAGSFTNFASSKGCTASVASAKGVWTASANSYTMTNNLGSDVLCVNGMTFDGANTTTFATKFTTGKPLYIISYGPIVLANGHKINYPTTNSPMYGAGSLRFYGASTLQVRNTNSGTNTTKAYGFWQIEGSCDIGINGSNYTNNGSNKAIVQGSLWCGGAMKLGQNSELWYDRQASNTSVDNNSGSISRIWTQVDYRSVVEGELDSSF